ncbi:2-C-methyl-D-erythritol 2,4-cyclodiphosphate synthase [Mycoplasmoides pirum]|uniref:2-C-methyl-D-erythritol 2,4-cyclodiphosphate synthase n=1 Tax=Mycoplasmoides pirum TaxID=2122 RepID=UPI000483B4B7|nr:2-C-methyl-D-erythritol 2,4-cyclodiphosphate synthase [Mycoplasmoides pirum]
MSFRIGIGFDNHFLKSKIKNKIKIGGVCEECDFEIISHSDGDVVFHSISDAILGALGLGDIGMYFSDKDPKNKNLNSEFIVNEVIDKMFKLKYEIVNLDLNIFSEFIKIDKIRNSIYKNLERLLNTKNINIKAKHFEEPKNQIACQSVILLKMKD